MFVLSTSSTDQKDIRSVLLEIRRIAHKFSCSPEDMVFVPGRMDLKRLPTDLAPSTVNELKNIVRTNEALVTRLSPKLACIITNER